MKTVIIVLGSPNENDGTLSSVATGRCELAIAEYNATPNARLLLTGGFGEHFNTTDKPHAFYLKQYLVSHGIPEDAFLACAESRNTIEDASLSRPIAAELEPCHIVVITSDYHEDRARYVFERTFKRDDIAFAIAETNEDQCELDIRELSRHEKEALQRLKQSGF